MRRPIVAGNWKMNTSVAEAIDLASGVRRGADSAARVEIVLCPPFTALKSVSEVLASSGPKLGAQNAHWEPNGAFTGEICVSMLADLGCSYVILGHSERRTYFNETDQGVNRKARAVLASGMTPIVCVGETLEQREADETDKVVRSQVERSLEGLGPALCETVVAYEPVWAIGTGRTASPEQVQTVHARIREVLAGMSDRRTADAVRIQYGGSVKPSNAAELFGLPDVDGGLIGGASLSAESFLEIVRAAG